jgi:hypothetical protein
MKVPGLAAEGGGVKPREGPRGYQDQGRALGHQEEGKEMQRPGKSGKSPA